MLWRVMLIGGAVAFVYACAKDEVRQDTRSDAPLERRVQVLEMHVRALEAGRAPAPARPPAP